MGTHILGIKDMAGLCKPYAAEKLVKACAKKSAFPSTSTRTTPAARSRHDLQGRRSQRRHRRHGDRQHERPDQPAESEFARRILRITRATPASISKRLTRSAITGKTCRKFYYPFESDMKAGTAEV